MAGMFYSLQEAAEKLNKTEEEVKQIVKEGNLREFRDGSNLLFKVEEVEALISGTGIMPSEQAPETQTPTPEVPEPEALEPEVQKPEVLEPEVLEPEVQEPEALEIEVPADETPAPSEQAEGTSEILLAPETETPAVPSELTDADTALTGEGISVLGETDSDYQVTDDTLAETAAPTDTTGTGPEVPLEEIEEDVNLDSFGSGSGLLDLSLQADDTSLGGILDEIYTAEVEGQEPAPAEVGSGSAAAVTAEAEQMLAEEEPVVPQPTPEIPAALARPYIETAPDMRSNTLGILLFLPLVVTLYTIVVTVAAQKDVMPSILPSSVQGLIWYIMGGAIGVTGLFIIAACMLGGGTAKAAKKPKPKKAPKAKKVKKPKEPKKPKKAKKAKKS
ncbi:MAG: hypothetical protein IIC00_13225 [Planctomycetes bacterium]|nr:hypothetical protein [Planctomycetota bacterium]